jgi:outer membrane scaffolding protein for murein synthesis (MipA/OmpV family)
MPARRDDARSDAGAASGKRAHRARPWNCPDSGATALALAALLASAAPTDAQAWGNLLLIEAPPASSTLAVGATTLAWPLYPGSDALRGTLLPGIDLYHSSGFFASTEQGLGWNLSQRSDVQAGVRLWPQPGRRRRDVPPAIAPIGMRLQQELFANLQALPVSLLQSGLLHGSGPHRDGMQLEVGATSGVPIGADLLAIGVAATYANAAHRQGYYGICTSDAAASVLRATPPLRAGWQDTSLSFSAEHRVDARWHVDGQLVVARLLGVSAPTPLVQSRRQVGATFSIWYDL